MSSKIKAILSNSWFMTLSATMIGVISGIFLTDYFDHRSKVKRKNIALTEVRKEIDSNYVILKTFNNHFAPQMEALDYVLEFLDDSLDISIPSVELDSFKIKSAMVYTIDSVITHNSKDMLELEGGLRISSQSSIGIADLVALRHSTLKNSSFIDLVDFSCLADIQGLYDVQKTLNELHHDLVAYILHERIDSGITRASLEDITRKWHYLAEYHTIYFDAYENHIDELFNNQCFQ